MKNFRPELLEPPQSFYARELGILSRPNRRGWASGPCPLHKSSNNRGRKKSTPFAVRFDSGAFNCLDPTCIASGREHPKRDIVDFAMLRDHLSFKDAAIKLGAWDVAPDAVDVRRREAEDRARKKKKDAEKQAAEERRRQRLDVRDNVHVLMHLQRAAAQRLDELHAGAESVSDSEVEDCWAAMAMVCDYERRMVREYRALAGVDRPEAEAVIYGE